MGSNPTATAKLPAKFPALTQPGGPVPILGVPYAIPGSPGWPMRRDNEGQGLALDGWRCDDEPGRAAESWG